MPGRGRDRRRGDDFSCVCFIMEIPKRQPWRVHVQPRSSFASAALNEREKQLVVARLQAAIFDSRCVARASRKAPRMRAEKGASEPKPPRRSRGAAPGPRRGASVRRVEAVERDARRRRRAPTRILSFLLPSARTQKVRRRTSTGEAYVPTASTTSERQSERNTGNELMSACFSSSVWSCLMHALSSHTRGSAGPGAPRLVAPRDELLELGGPGSCHGAKMKPSTWPSAAAAVFSYTRVGATDEGRTPAAAPDSRSARKRAHAVGERVRRRAAADDPLAAIVAASSRSAWCSWLRSQTGGSARDCGRRDGGDEEGHEDESSCHQRMSPPKLIRVELQSSPSAPRVRGEHERQTYIWPSAAQRCARNIVRFGQQNEQHIVAICSSRSGDRPEKRCHHVANRASGDGQCKHKARARACRKADKPHPANGSYRRVSTRLHSRAA